MKILIAGGTGFIGAHLSQSRSELGDTVVAAGRTLALANHKESYDVIINLAGESLADEKWTARRKESITRSRLQTTQMIIDYIAHTPNKPQLLLNGSAIGFYSKNPFLRELCEKWEQLAFQAQAFGVRVCTLRTGIVLGKNGGALLKMLKPIKLGLGAILGHGNQWMSWIHIEDVIGIINHLILNEGLSGPVDLTSPNPVSNADFTRELARAVGRPVPFRIPERMVRWIWGEMGEAFLLESIRVAPEAALESGYRFLYPTLGRAFRDLF